MEAKQALERHLVVELNTSACQEKQTHSCLKMFIMVRLVLGQWICLISSSVHQIIPQRNRRMCPSQKDNQKSAQRCFSEAQTLPKSVQNTTAVMLSFTYNKHWSAAVSFIKINCTLQCRNARSYWLFLSCSPMQVTLFH